MKQISPLLLDSNVLYNSIDNRIYANPDLIYEGSDIRGKLISKMDLTSYEGLYYYDLTVLYGDNT